MRITNFGKKLLAFFLVVTSAFFLFACQQGGAGENGTSPRAEAKQYVQELLSQFKFGDTIDGVCTEVKTSNFEIQEDLDGVVSESDWANGSYSEYKHGLSASFESSNPEVLYTEWQTSVTRNYVTENDKIVGIEMGERKALVFVVNPQAEATDVVVTITVTATYEVNGHTYTYKDSQDTTFTVGPKVGDAVEMTIGEMQALAMADWASFTNNGLVDAEGNKYSVSMKGVVTEELWGDGSDAHSFMMSDENGDNVFVYAPAGSCMIGDEVIVTGVPAAYYDGIQIGKGATVQVLSGGHEVAAPLEISIDEWYEKYDIKVNHNAVGERIKTKAILTYDGSNYILKSTESDKHFVIYYKSYNSYELELLQQFLGKVAIYEFAVYDHHSAGYWRALVNNYDYVPEEVVLTDKEALDADLTTIPGEFEVKNGETVDLPAGELVNGSVIGAWSADHEGLIDLETGKVNLGDIKETTVVTLTATVTKGEAVQEVQIKVTIVYVKPDGPTYSVTTEHEVGVAYKFGMVQENLGKELFLNGELDGNFFASVDDASLAADVYLEATEGGYYFYFEKDGAKKYICIANDTGYISFSDAPSNVWTYNEEYNTLVSAVYNDTFYLGSYKEYSTFSKSKISYAATSFVAHLYKADGVAEKPTCEVTTEHNVGVAYKFGMVQDNLGKELFLSGELDGNFFASVEDPAQAADVYLEAAEGGYYFYFEKDDAKKYICIANDTGYISFSDAPSNVWTYNEEYNTLVSAVYNDTFYLGSYKEYSTFSKSKISYAATSFVAHLYKYEVPGQEPEVPGVVNTIAGALAAEVGTEVELTGKVVEIYQAWSDQYKNISFYIEDATGKILVFRTGTLAEIGDTVTVKGTIAVYNNVNQIGQGAITEVIEKAPVEEPDPEATSAIIKFDDKANRTEFSEEIQVWEQNGIKVTNTKHESTQPIADYANPARFYAKTRLVISAENKISKIVFTTAGSKNFNANFALEGFIVTVNGTSCTIESTEGVDNITIDLTYQVRVSQIEVFFAGAGNNPEPDPEPDPEPGVITSIAEALAAEAGAQVELTGKVTEIYYAWDEGYGNMSVYIEDASGKILAFRMKTQVEIGDTIKVTGTLTAYNGVNQIAAGCTAEIVEKAPAEPEVIKTVAEALAADAGAQVELTGKVVEIYQAWNTQYNNMSFYLEDATGKILAFRTGTLVEVGDTVKVQGTLTVYSGTNQIAQGCTTEIIEKAPVVEPEPEPELPEGTVVVKIADYAAANGWSNGVMYNTLQLNDKVSAQLSAVAGSGTYGANTGKYYTSGNNWRMYQADQEATLVIAAVEGTKIVSVKVTYTAKNTGTLLLGETAIESDYVVEVNASSITFTIGNTNSSVTNGQAQITAIQVVLEEEAAEPVVTGGRADLETMDYKGTGNYTGGTSSYTSLTSTNGWVSNNAALLVGGTTDANPVFQFIGADNTTKAVTINGKSGAEGTLSSPTLQGGISKITFNYGHAFADKNGVDINVIITEVATGNVVTLNLKKEAADVTQKTAYVAEFVLEAPVAGEFTIQFTNNCPTNATKNADRVSLWNIEWVGYVA